MRGTKSVGVLILTGIVLVSLSGCAGSETEKNKTAQVAKAPEVVPVKIASVGKEKIADIVQLSGVMAAKNEMVVTSKIGGELKTLTQEVGDTVVKGEILANLDDTQYKLQKKKAELGLETAKASLKNAADQLARVNALFASGSVTQVDIDQAKLQHQMADIAVRNAQLDIEGIVLNLSYCQIVSPFNGVVTERKGAIGENIGAGQLLYHLVDTTNLVVETGVAEGMVSRLKEGAKVQLTLLGKEPLSGRIETVSSVMDQASKTYPVRIAVSNTNKSLKVGMTVSVEIALGGIKETLAVEKGSVIISNESYYVMKVVDGKAIKTQITIGATSATHYEVLTGLNMGEQIVTSNPGLLKGNETIKVVQ